MRPVALVEQGPLGVAAAAARRRSPLAAGAASPAHLPSQSCHLLRCGALQEKMEDAVGLPHHAHHTTAPGAPAAAAPKGPPDWATRRASRRQGGRCAPHLLLRPEVASYRGRSSRCRWRPQPLPTAPGSAHRLRFPPLLTPRLRSDHYPGESHALRVYPDDSAPAATAVGAPGPAAHCRRLRRSASVALSRVAAHAAPSPHPCRRRPPTPAPAARRASNT